MIFSAMKSSSECDLINLTSYVHQDDNDDYYNVDDDNDDDE
jgi:hypothetical protein